MKKVYYDSKSPGSYGGVDRLKRNTKHSKQTVIDWLQTQDTYTLHKPIRRNFTRRRVNVGGINQQLQGDLIDVRNLKPDNDGVSFLLTLIDVFSRVAYVAPLQNKSGLSMVKAFTDYFSVNKPPLKIQTDRGVEFKNKLVQNLFKDKGVDFFVSKNEDIKASIVERFNRTIKEKIYRYLTYNNTTRYIDDLQNIVKSYNNSYHRSIKRAPFQVNFQNQEEVWQTLYHSPVQEKEVDLKEGDRVRISKTKGVFEKGYLPNWTMELFTISQVLYRTQPRTYKLKDDNGDELEGTFYPQELQRVANKEIYRISNILKSRRNKGQQEVLIEWLGYPSSFNSWIPATNIQTY